MNNTTCFIIICFLATLMGCNDEETFPKIRVSHSIPITMPEWNNVYSNTWGYEYIENVGLGGIIIVQAIDNQFIAYDRACTFEKNNECVISGDYINDTMLQCNGCCNSQFNIIDGSIFRGPANQALKRYNTYFDGQILYITN